MARKADVVPLSRFRRGDPLENVPEIKLGPSADETRTAIVTPTPSVDLTDKPKVWFMLGNGGVGKTTYARWLIARMSEQGRSATLAALDPGSRALSAWFDDIEQPPSRDSGRTEKWLGDFLDFVMTEKMPAILDFGAAGEVSLRSVVDSTKGLA